MVALGYGRWVRAYRIFALVPVERERRGEGQRTYVHVEGIDAPVVASRSERALLADVERALTNRGCRPYATAPHGAIPARPASA